MLPIEHIGKVVTAVIVNNTLIQLIQWYLLPQGLSLGGQIRKSERFGTSKQIISILEIFDESPSQLSEEERISTSSDSIKSVSNPCSFMILH